MRVYAYAGGSEMPRTREIRCRQAKRVVVAMLGLSACASCGARSSLEAASDTSTLPPSCTATEGLITIASEQVRPLSIAVNATSVFWSTYNSDSVMTCASCGCNGSPMALPSEQNPPSSLAVSGANVSWIQANSGAVMTCATGDCGTPTQLGVGSTCAMGGFVAGGGCLNLAADADSVYWSTANAVVKCPIGGCGGNPTTLASGQNSPSGVVVDTTNVYWIDGDAILSCAVGGCGGTPTTLASGQFANALAVGGGNVYWTSGSMNVGAAGAVMKCAALGCNGAPTTLASGLTQPVGITADAASVYWTNYLSGGGADGTGSVMKCAASGCGSGPTTLASGQDYPVAIAVDATSVYWTNDGGDTVFKLTPK